MTTNLPLTGQIRLAVVLISELIALMMVGCTTIAFHPVDSPILAGKWKAVGPEFQDYYFKVVIEKQEVRLNKEPEVRFKDEAAKSKYDQKYGAMSRTVNAFANAMSSIGAIAEIGGSRRTTADFVDQSWDSAKNELLWVKRTYEVLDGKRNPNPIYNFQYKIDFESDHEGTMLFDGKNFKLERLK